MSNSELPRVVVRLLLEYQGESDTLVVEESGGVMWIRRECEPCVSGRERILLKGNYLVEVEAP